MQRDFEEKLTELMQQTKSSKESFKDSMNQAQRAIKESNEEIDELNKSLENER